MAKWQGQDDKDWADQFEPELKGILLEHVGQNLGRFIELLRAPEFDDLHRATDMVIRITGGDVAVRVRRPEILWREWTVRKSRPSGRETEVEKILAGFARWYLYCWTTVEGLSAYVIIDLDRVRKKGILDAYEWERKPNRDGSSDFIIVPLARLNAALCIVASKGVGAYL